MNSFTVTALQIFFIILVIMALVAVVRYFRYSMSRRVSGDTRALLLILSLLTVGLVGLLGAKKIGSWRSGGDANIPGYDVATEAVTTQLDRDEHEYLQTVYMPLEKSYKQLQQNIEGIKIFKRRLTGLLNEFPNHKKLLESILADFNKEEREQHKMYNRVHREIRYAIIQSSTQDMEYVDQQFYGRAKSLDREIAKRQKVMDSIIKKTASKMESNLGKARRILTNGKPRVNGKVEEHSFSAKTINKLSAFLFTKSPDLSQQTTSITQEIMIAERKKELMRQLSMKNQDLSQPLNKTMTLWHKAEVSARQHWGDILYTLETLYLADQLNMPVKNPSYSLLFKTLEKQTSVKLSRIRKKRSQVEKSFISPEKALSHQSR